MHNTRITNHTQRKHTETGSQYYHHAHCHHSPLSCSSSKFLRATCCSVVASYSTSLGPCSTREQREMWHSMNSVCQWARTPRLQFGLLSWHAICLRYAARTAQCARLGVIERQHWQPLPVGARTRSTEWLARVSASF